MLSSQERGLTAAFVVIITIVYDIIILGLIVIIALEIFIVIVIIFNCGASSASSSSLTPSAELLSRLWWVNSKSQANQLQISFYFFLLFLKLKYVENVEWYFLDKSAYKPRSEVGPITGVDAN